MFNDEEKQGDELKRVRDKEAEDLAQILSVRYKIPYVDLNTVTIELDALAILKEEEARKAKVAVFQRVDKKIQVAIQSPNPEATQAILKGLERDGYFLTVHITSEAGLERAWKRYADIVQYKEASKGVIDISAEKIEELLTVSQTLPGIAKLVASVISDLKSHRVTELLEVILAGGIGAEASDVHLEPEESSVKLRYRLDGVLHDLISISKDAYALLLSRIKLISGLKLNLRDNAQDGRFSIKVGGSETEVRTSVIPEAYGESIVLRILDPKSIGVPFEKLGMEPIVREALAKEIARPNGMILTTGPTGSGKTTTLYAFLNKIHSADIKIITLEDPIEYHLSGVIQTQVNKDKHYTFAEGLRSILRQDPDVIMVGEIRDIETAQIAVNAALTGHLVFSTLHTNDAPGAIPRLVDLGEKPANLAPALNAVLAQRLVRKLCSCHEMVFASDEEQKGLSKIFAEIPEKYKEGLIAGEKFTVGKAKGCEKCNNIGYKGRIGVYELIVVNDDIKKLVIEKNPDALAIRDAWKAQEMLSMKEDGVLKILAGITSWEELKRVVDV